MAKAPDTKKNEETAVAKSEETAVAKSEEVTFVRVKLARPHYRRGHYYKRGDILTIRSTEKRSSWMVPVDEELPDDKSAGNTVPKIVKSQRADALARAAEQGRD